MPDIGDGETPTVLEPGGTNAVGRMLGLVGDEWTLLIVQQSLLGATRYSEFAARLPISHSVLTNRLRALTRDGLLVRKSYQANPGRAEYLVTRRSRSLWPVLLSIWEWERHWVTDRAERLPEMHHTSCDSDFAPSLICRSCSEVVTEKDIDVRWGPSGSWRRSVPETATRRRSDSGERLGDEHPSRAGLFPETMSILGNRWASALLVAAFRGTTRFTDFQTQLGAAPGSIADRLQVFGANGVLAASARSRPEVPRYRLTEKGRAFFPVLIASSQWADRWFRAPEGPAVVLTHRACGEQFVGILACDQCARPLAGSHIR